MMLGAISFLLPSSENMSIAGCLRRIGRRHKRHSTLALMVLDRGRHGGPVGPVMRPAFGGLAETTTERGRSSKNCRRFDVHVTRTGHREQPRSARTESIERTYPMIKRRNDDNVGRETSVRGKNRKLLRAGRTKRLRRRRRRRYPIVVVRGVIRVPETTKHGRSGCVPRVCVRRTIGRSVAFRASVISRSAVNN